MKSHDLVNWRLVSYAYDTLADNDALTLPHFMGYRFGLFNFATKATDGSADFDFFRISAERF